METVLTAIISHVLSFGSCRQFLANTSAVRVSYAASFFFRILRFHLKRINQSLFS